MFVDSIILEIKSGNGGNGSISFFKNKTQDGGPDGGNGGNGGNIFVCGDKSLTNLFYLRWHKKVYADNGQNGSSNGKTGKNGKDKIIYCPIGTEIYYNNKIIEITNEKKYFLIKGGKGGIGNKKLANSINQAPEYSVKGEQTKVEKIELKLKLVGDIGIIGSPNSGKSSLLNLITGAKSKVGDYSFSTTYPQLGCYKGITFIDIPGIIENSSSGKGLGVEFLKHAEKCKIIIILIDVSSNPKETYNMLINEINNYGLKKEFIVCFSKCDLITNKQKKILKKDWPNALFISSIFSPNSIKNLVNFISKKLSIIKANIDFDLKFINKKEN